MKAVTWPQPPRTCGLVPPVGLKETIKLQHPKDASIWDINYRTGMALKQGKDVTLIQWLRLPRTMLKGEKEKDTAVGYTTEVVL